MTVNSYSGIEVIITIAGKIYSAADLNAFEIDVIDKDEGDNEIDIHCTDSDFSIADSALFRVGALLSLKWGYVATGNYSQERTGYVLMKSGTRYDHSGIISTLHATTKSATLAARRPQKNYGKVSLATIVKEIAQRSSMTLNLTGGEEYLDGFSQGNWSDRETLRVLADRFGYQASFTSETITFAPRKFSATPSFALIFGDGEESNVIRAEMSVDVHSHLGAASGVSVASYDPASKTMTCHASGNPDQELNVYAGDGHSWLTKQNPDSKPSAGSTIISTTSKVTSQWVANAGLPQSPTGGLSDGVPSDVQALLSSPDFSSDNAAMHANSLNQRAQKKHADLVVDTVGIPQACARLIVEVKGVSKRDSGLFYVTKVEHKIKTKGTYECVFDLNRHGTNAGGAKVKAPVNMQSSHDSGASTSKSVSVSASTGQMWSSH